MMATSQRVLSLEGGCNLRDMGGYRTTDGRRIRPGLLFRSGVMSYFSPNDHAQLSALKLRTICDLRSADEREKEPTRWPTEVEMISWDVEQGHLKHVQNEAFGDAPNDGAHIRQTMINTYQAMPAVMRPQLQGIFRCLLGDAAPLLFHCAAGKDRTGFSAAIVLHTLGAPRETIFEDYELTNQAVDLKAFVLQHKCAALGLAAHPLQTMKADVRNALLIADRTYLSAAFGQIEKDYGSIDDYVRDILGLDADVIAQLRTTLLQSGADGTV